MRPKLGRLNALTLSHSLSLSLLLSSSLALFVLKTAETVGSQTVRLRASFTSLCLPRGAGHVCVCRQVGGPFGLSAGGDYVFVAEWGMHRIKVLKFDNKLAVLTSVAHFGM